VTTDIGGCAEVVTPETGFVVDSRDEDAVVTALSRLADEPELRAEMGARAREHVERYRVERLLADIDDLYQELLGAERAS
jgi:glycosyltransferase involved in cell wall biosynthesis